jgi:GGDEF domain-containing protein
LGFLITALSLSQIKKLLKNEQAFARIDSLTGVANRRAFYELAEIEIERAARFNRLFTLAYIVDNLKR